jgi:hypothetical protein
MEAKQKAIQAAFGDAWEKVKDFLDKDGWCCGIHAIEAGWSEDYDWNQGCWRPKALAGIVNNNGWIRRDERLPNVKGDYYVCINGEFDGEVLHSHEICLAGNPLEVTHWRPIDPVNPPIY